MYQESKQAQEPCGCDHTNPTKRAQPALQTSRGNLLTQSHGEPYGNLHMKKKREE
jgi:hypothetical protein